jgi:hypothetical protein
VKDSDGDLAAIRTHDSPRRHNVPSTPSFHGDIIATASTDPNATALTARRLDESWCLARVDHAAMTMRKPWTGMVGVIGVCLIGGCAGEAADDKTVPIRSDLAQVQGEIGTGVGRVGPALRFKPPAMP